MTEEVHPGSDPDLDLVRALQRGDDSALDHLMGRHKEPLFRFVHRYVLNEVDAVELTQETFVRAYFAIHQFKPSAKFSTWLYRIALNLCRDYAKSRRSKQSSVTDSLSDRDDNREEDRELPAGTKTPSEEALAAEQLAAVEKAIAQLPHDLRAPLVLTALEQRSHQECAELLKTTPKAIETRVYRARKLLGELLRKAGF